jgi:hypothetical protein
MTSRISYRDVVVTFRMAYVFMYRSSTTQICQDAEMILPS